MANSVDPDQLASSESGSTLFAKAGYIRVQHLKGYITKTCLYNLDPLKPHFYTVKLGFTGVYIIFLFLL